MARQHAQRAVRHGVRTSVLLVGFAAGAGVAAAQTVPSGNPPPAADEAVASGLGGDGGAAAVHLVPPAVQRPARDEVAALDAAEQVRRDRAAQQAAQAEAARQEAARQETARQQAEQAARNRVYAPVTGVITSNYGPRWGTTHYGLDIANKLGTPIRAPLAGVVTEAGPASGFGLWVRIRHDDGTITVYGHINSYSVREGQRVQAGQVIAEVGNRGYSTGPHLHFEVWSPGGQKVDPLDWLQDRGADVTAS